MQKAGFCASLALAGLLWSLSLSAGSDPRRWHALSLESAIDLGSLQIREGRVYLWVRHQRFGLVGAKKTDEQMYRHVVDCEQPAIGVAAALYNYQGRTVERLVLLPQDVTMEPMLPESAGFDLIDVACAFEHLQRARHAPPAQGWPGRRIP